MSLNRSIAFNITSQIYGAIAGIVSAPIFLKAMGPEAYGLVAFFSILQALFNVLDLGLAPTLSRETAKALQTRDTCLYLATFRSIRIVFFTSALIAVLAFYLMNDYIASHWLKNQHISIMELQYCLNIMILIAAFRWISGFYKSALFGFEDFAWLSIFSILINTLRFFLCIPFIYLYNGSPIAFFIYQMFVSIFELIASSWKARASISYHFSSQTGTAASAGLLETLRPLIGFSLSTAFTSIVWTIVSQTDKLLLSRLLPLADFGYFSLGVTLAGGLILLGSSITSTATPRLTSLYSSGKEKEASAVYRSITRYVVLAITPPTLTMTLLSERILYLWTDSTNGLATSAPVLVAYALGNYLMILASLPLLIQIAVGNVRIHLLSNILYALALYPSMLFGVSNFGILGACACWIGLNLLSFIISPALVHRRFLPRMHAKWLLHDIGVVAMPAVVIGLATAHFVPITGMRFVDILLIGLHSALSFSATVFLSGHFGKEFFKLAILSRLRLPRRI